MLRQIKFKMHFYTILIFVDEGMIVSWATQVSSCLTNKCYTKLQY